MKILMKNKYQKQGFTLIELMIVVAIIGILSTASLIMLSDGRDQKAVDLVARQVASTMRMTQNYAVSGRIFQSNKIPCKYIFTTSAAAGTYSILYTHRSVNGGACGLPETVVTYPVSDNVTITNTSVDFQLPRGDASSNLTVGLSRGSASNAVRLVGSSISEDR